MLDKTRQRPARKPHDLQLVLRLQCHIGAVRHVVQLGWYNILMRNLEINCRQFSDIPRAPLRPRYRYQGHDIGAGIGQQLRTCEIGEGAAFSHELGLGADLDDGAAIHHTNEISRLHGR